MTARTITINKDKCIHCGLCIKDCIVSCLEFDSEKIPCYKPYGDKMCVACQHCMAICPAGALSFGDLNPEDSSPVTHGNAQDLMNMIKSRRSIRAYKKEDISPEKIALIAEMLAYSPRGGNVDALHFTIISTRNKMDEIRNATYEKILALEADGDTSSMTKMLAEGWRNNNDIIYRGAPAMILGAVDRDMAVEGCDNADPIIALSYMELYAYSLGLGVLWDDMIVYYVLKNFPEITAMLDIPEGYTPIYGLVMGVPAVKYSRSVQKKAASVKIL